MQYNSSSSFACYILTTEEQLNGTLLSPETKAFIQNQINAIAEEKLGLIPDATNYPVFIQQEAHLAGQIHILRYLLDCAISSEAQLKEASGNNQ